MANRTTKKPPGALPSLGNTGAGYTPIVSRGEPLEEPKGKGKYKRSGHLQDQLLKYIYPRDGSSQLSIFDSLQEETKKKIHEAKGIEVTEMVEGIRLSPSETKVVDSLCKLLHERSQTLDPKKKGYYSGNAGSRLVSYGKEETLAPNLAFTLYELTSEYKGGDYVSGRDLENVAQVLRELDAKRFLMSYVETYFEKEGGKNIQTVRKVEEFRRLIRIERLSETKYTEGVELSKKEVTVISLNPIFRHQIDSKFILYPNDITKRTTIAYGSHNVPEITLRLREYLMRELSAKHYTPKIGLERLYYVLAEKWMNESRKKKVKEYTEKALETVTALGLLVSYEMQTSHSGEPMVVFTLNKDWE